MNRKLLFAIYTYPYLMLGLSVNCLGPIIPYLADASGKLETQFSFLFFSRAIGCLAGGFFNPYLTKLMPPHRQLSFVQLIGGIAFVLLSMTYNSWVMGFLIFVGSAFNININAVIMVCILKLFKNDRPDFWLQMMNIMFALGGFIAPFLIISLKEKTLLVIGIFLIFGSMGVYFIPQIAPSEDEETSTPKTMCIRSELHLCLGFFLLIGLELGFVSWIPTYLLMQNVTSIQKAALVASLFWFTDIAFRVILLFMKGTVAQRGLKLLFLNASATVFIAACAFMGLEMFAAFFGAFAIGACLSIVYPLFMSLPGQYDIMINQQNAARFTVASSIGEAIVTTNVGNLMQMVSPLMLYVSSLTIGILLYFNFKKTVRCFELQFAKKSPTNIQLLELNGIDKNAHC